MATTPESTVGGWKLLEQLGAGGMGEVWKARGPSGQAAVKLLPAAASPMEAQRFQREAESLLQVNHGNVVRAYDFGRSDAGTLYLAMELLDGESLDARLTREGRLKIAEATGLMRQAARGARRRSPCRDRPPGRETGEPVPVQQR